MKLKPCQCGCSNVLPVVDTECDEVLIECKDCGATSGRYLELKYAIETWNNRPRENELLEALEEALRTLNRFAPDWYIDFASQEAKNKWFKQIISKYKGGDECEKDVQAKMEA